MDTVSLILQRSLMYQDNVSTRYWRQVMTEIYLAMLVIVAYVTGRIIGQVQTKRRFMRVYNRNKRLIEKGKEL